MRTVTLLVTAAVLLSIITIGSSVPKADADCTGEAPPDCVVASSENAMSIAVAPEQDVSIGVVGGTIVFEISLDVANIPYEAFYWEVVSDGTYVDFVSTGPTPAWIAPDVDCTPAVPVDDPNSSLEGFAQAYCILLPIGEVTTTFTGVGAKVTIECTSPTPPGGTTMYMIGPDFSIYGSRTLEPVGEPVPTELFPQTPFQYAPPAYQAGVTYHCVADPPPLEDGDGDNCPNGREDGGSHLAGGERNKLSPWDFYDVPVPALTPSQTSGIRDRIVSISDVLAILSFNGTSSGGMTLPSGVSYDGDLNANGVPDGQEHDRTPSIHAGMAWRSGPPNGAVSIQDVLVALGQVGDNCM